MLVKYNALPDQIGEAKEDIDPEIQAINLQDKLGRLTDNASWDLAGKEPHPALIGRSVCEWPEKVARKCYLITERLTRVQVRLRGPIRRPNETSCSLSEFQDEVKSEMQKIGVRSKDAEEIARTAFQLERARLELEFEEDNDDLDI